MPYRGTKEKEIKTLKEYKVRGHEVNFVVEVENLSTDAVTGSWTGNAYGTVIFSRASANNPMWNFEPVAVSVQPDGDGVVASDKTYQVVQNASTGFVGVRSADANAIKAGSVVAVYGVFTRPLVDALPSGEGNSFSTYGTEVLNDKFGNTVN